MSALWYIGADETETLTGVSAGGGFLNSATVTYVLKDAAGTTIVGGTGSYTYTPASSGDYTAVIDGAVTALLTDTFRYILVVTIVSSTYNDVRYLERWAAKRAET